MLNLVVTLNLVVREIVNLLNFVYEGGGSKLLSYYRRVYSVIEPGDTIRVIGEFDLEHSCNVNREKNLVIVHPNLLLSGTRVSFALLSLFVFNMLLVDQWLVKCCAKLLYLSRVRSKL